MLDQVKTADNADILYKFMTSLGKFNDMPEPFAESTEQEFHSYLFTYNPLFIDWKQIRFEGKFYTVRVFYFYDRGFMITEPVYRSVYKAGVRVDQVLKRPMRVWRLGCVHEYREMGQEQCRAEGISHFGNCWHVERCHKCQMVHSYDSSG